jgi:bifunctional UDP-N-acetylglucosamine pyrophosphorylase / glucosamine-1-phosphate N-acetyltransferase
MALTNNTAALILAAGQGKRMRSALPKILHPCCDVPLIAHVVNLALTQQCSPIVVVLSPGSNDIQDYLSKRFAQAPLRFAIQEKPLGTGDAAKAGLKALDHSTLKVLLLYGDVPLLTPQSIDALTDAVAQVAFLTAHVNDPTGYGRVIEKQNRFKIVEDKDCSEDERRVQQVNAGVYLCDLAVLQNAVARLENNNAQNEFYLTDIVALADTATPVAVDFNEVRGVNNQEDLVTVEQIMRQRLVRKHLLNGVRFTSPDTIFVGADVVFGNDVVLGVGVQVYGKTKIADGARIEGPCIIRDSQIGQNARVYGFSHLENAIVGSDCHVGPFARLRPGAKLEEQVRVGNFVEIKNATLGLGSKANHLAYIGDAEVGEQCNIGAGTITCNYDGKNKHRTILRNHVFVGSNSTLVAPVTLEEGSYIAAGSTISHDVPKDALAFGRARQSVREGYAAKLKNK